MTVTGPITNGRDFNFFDTKTISAVAFATDADIVINIKNVRNLIMTNYGTAVVEYSFNGTTVHGDMRFGTPTAHLVFNGRAVSKVWFRVPSSTAEVRVEAWAGV